MHFSRHCGHSGEQDISFVELINAPFCSTGGINKPGLGSDQIDSFALFTYDQDLIQILPSYFIYPIGFQWWVFPPQNISGTESGSWPSPPSFFLHLLASPADVTQSHDFKIHLLICGPPLVKKKEEHSQGTAYYYVTMYWQ